jgi:hypothetical protein
MTRDEQIEAAASAHREGRGDGTIADSAAWHDLDEQGRRAAYDVTRGLRMLEAALDDDGLSTTARAVLRRIKEGR